MPNPATPTTSRPIQHERQAKSSRTRASCAALLSTLLVCGCAGITAHENHVANALADWKERIDYTRSLSGATSVVVARNGLAEIAANDPGTAARLLENKLQATSDPQPDGALALAELSYQAGLAQPSRAPELAMAWYRDAATLAALALAEPKCSSPNQALQIHNGALARLIRVSQDQAGRDGRNWRQILANQDVALGSPAPHLKPERIADLRVAGDLWVKGFDHVYYTDGVGVPVVAHRLQEPQESNNPREQFLPPDLRTSATAVLYPGGGLADGAWKRKRATLVLFDPLSAPALDVGGRSVELAGDRTSALAAEVSRSHLATLEWVGLLEPDMLPEGADSGIYMLRPYEPGKIPVMFVHGLGSSPRSWAQTINELQNTPELAARYQFWVFLYPTGLPIPTSAARLRKALIHARNTLDPKHEDGSLDRMVLVGHSMGGLLSKMMVQDSGLTLWNSAIAVPFDDFQAPAELRKVVDETLVFKPLPFVRRVVFIATPHRGSPLANDLVGEVASNLVRRPDDVAKQFAKIESLNGRDVISHELMRKGRNAVGNLRTDSPILAALNKIRIDPAVPFHSIIPLVGGVAGTDGVVEYKSSHLENAASEKTLSGTHFSQQKPEVSEELRRILRLHAEPVETDNASRATE
jgi:pimeloyl-ACP methyl ester carboxylesterase